MNLSPVALFTYTRVEHLRRAVEALSKNKLAGESKLFVFSDGPKDEKDKLKVGEVRRYLKTIKGFKEVEIIEREKNYGLANSIIDGVTKVVQGYGRVIILEDDLLSSPYFLRFMNDGLDLYENEDRIGAVCGYMYSTKEQLPETFFLKFFNSWGWATWKDKWRLFEQDPKKLLDEIKRRNLSRKFDLDNSYFFTQSLKLQSASVVSSWAIRWYASLFLNDRLSLFSGKSLVMNIGFGKGGSHTKTWVGNYIFGTEIYDKPINVFQIPIEENKAVRKIVRDYFRKPKVFLMIKIMKIRNWLKLMRK